MRHRLTPLALVLGLGCAPGESVVGGVTPDAGVVADVTVDRVDVVDVAPPACRTDGECNDEVGCTVDACRGGRCEHTPSSALCPLGSACETTRGCRPVRACA
ncbi:MAG: keratin associated protein, partial [Myxococcaceae bacterium]|nr:keratin associated protein [Myxococcaceae bacterium]